MWRKIFTSTNIRNRCSALFINGTKATETFVFITPHLDFSNQINHKEKIKNELVKRHSAFDLNKLENVWAMYEEIKQRKMQFETKKTEIANELNNLIKTSPESEEVNKLKIKIDLIKENIKILKKPFWSAEEIAIVEYLKLPNALHEATPDNENIIFTHLSQPRSKKNHLDIGEKLDILTFKKNENYYLKDDAAIFELGAKFHFSHNLKAAGFIQFSNTDFVKSVIVEGCGGDHRDPDSTFILHHNEESKVNIDNRLHLTGAGSLCSFFAYHAKNVANAKSLPLKYFTIGRQYTPSPSDEDCLFFVSQSSVVQLFEVARDECEQQTVFEELLSILKEIYSDLGYHFRVTAAPAHKLEMWESYRLSVEMYSSSKSQYIEVANVSLSGDYISKRLLYTYIDKKQSKFPFIISGTILNVPKLLGCVLEQDDQFVVPEKFLPENWKIN